MESNYSYVDENLKLIRENVGEAAEKCGRKTEDIRIMAVTKTVAPDLILLDGSRQNRRAHRPR